MTEPLLNTSDTPPYSEHYKVPDPAWRTMIWQPMRATRGLRVKHLPGLAKALPSESQQLLQEGIAFFSKDPHDREQWWRDYYRGILMPERPLNERIVAALREWVREAAAKQFSRWDLRRFAAAAPEKNPIAALEDFMSLLDGRVVRTGKPETVMGYLRHQPVRYLR